MHHVRIGSPKEDFLVPVQKRAWDGFEEDLGTLFSLGLFVY